MNVCVHLCLHVYVCVYFCECVRERASVVARVHVHVCMCVYVCECGHWSLLCVPLPAQDADREETLREVSLEELEECEDDTARKKAWELEM